MRVDSAVMDGSARITLRRARTFRGEGAFDVVLDGEVAGQVRNGGDLTIETWPGYHELSVRRGRRRGPALALDLAAGSTAELFTRVPPQAR